MRVGSVPAGPSLHRTDQHACGNRRLLASVYFGTVIVMCPLERDVPAGRCSPDPNVPTGGSERIPNDADLRRETLTEWNMLAGRGLVRKLVVQLGGAADPALRMEAFEPEDDEFAELAEFAFPRACEEVEHAPIVPSGVRA